MRNSKLIVPLAVAVSTILGIGASCAADMAVKAGSMAVDPGINWSGFYVGLNGGYGWNSTNTNILYTAPLTGFAGFSNGFESKGGFGGIEAGYNWQRDHIVFGLETDFEFANIGDRFNVTTPSNGLPLTVNATQRLNGFGTVRGRLGLAYGSALFYATGGFAYGSVSNDILLTNGGANANLTANGNGIKTGYTAGGGVEYRFTPAWSAKLEYQYMDLGSRNVSGISTNAVFLTSDNINAKFHTVRFGLNYAWGAPVMAKY